MFRSVAKKSQFHYKNTVYYLKKMFERPRCRNWTPLATQQLRLRNLVAITGQCIVCDRNSQVYFTLHTTAMSAPFYTSEKVTMHSSGIVEWPEINCPKILKSSCKSVCIRVWEHKSLTQCKKLMDENIGDVNTKTKVGNDNICDKLLFVWGVYFSGLILLTKRSEAFFHPNSLSFQMHGGYFASPSSLTEESMRQQLRFMYYSDHPTLRDSASFKTKELLAKTAGKSCDIFSNISLIRDLEDDKKKQRFELMNTSANNKFQISSPRTSRSCSPIQLENCLPTSPIDFGHDLLQMLKIRYLDKIFLKSEIRPSYSLSKLLQLQAKQRAFKHRCEDAKEIIEKICTKSAYCLNMELISNKLITYRSNKYNPSMGRTLNRLLCQEAEIKPEDILKAQEYRRQIETAKFRCRLLRDQRDKIVSTVDQLRKKSIILHDNKIEQESWIMSSYRNLSREKEVLRKEMDLVKEKRENLHRTQITLDKRQRQLCCELQEIYPIEQKSKDRYYINNVFLPNMEKVKNETKRLTIDYVWEPVAPLSLSVGLGYVAHVVQMCSILLNIPLRNPIIHEGSKSRIKNITRNSPNLPRELPLYCRSSPPPKIVFYAVHLLCQNIAQLNFDMNGIRCDLTMILPNLQKLLKNDILDSSSEHFKYSFFQESGSSSMNDLNYQRGLDGFSDSIPILSLNKMNTLDDDTELNVDDQRVSRSVGSYTDESFSTSEKQFYNSEPILTITNSNHSMDIQKFEENESL